ncbi:unnamed protein product [Ectocarpus sp. 6 AP-2014]
MGEDGLGDVMCLSAGRAFRPACYTAFRTNLSTYLSAWVGLLPSAVSCSCSCLLVYGQGLLQTLPGDLTPHEKEASLWSGPSSMVRVQQAGRVASAELNALEKKPSRVRWRRSNPCWGSRRRTQTAPATLLASTLWAVCDVIDVVVNEPSTQGSSKPLSDWSATDLVQGHGRRGQAQDRRDGGVPIVHGFQGGLRPTNYVMMLAASSSFKGMDDMAKYDEAMEDPGGFHGEAQQSRQAYQAGAEADAENHQERKGVGAAQVEQQQEEGAVRALQKAKVKANAKTDAEKVAATKAGETAKALRKTAQQARQEAMHLFAKNPSAESVEGRIKTFGVFGESTAKLELEA